MLSSRFIPARCSTGSGSRRGSGAWSASRRRCRPPDGVIQLVMLVAHGGEVRRCASRADRFAASGVGDRTRAALAGVAAAVRAVRNGVGEDAVGTRRFKTDDRDCAARCPACPVKAAAGGRRRPGSRRCSGDGLAIAGSCCWHSSRALRQRLHDQLNALAPGLSAPAGHGRALALGDVDSAGRSWPARPSSPARAPTDRSLMARAPGRLSDANARFWAQRWKRLLAPPADAELRAAAPRPRRRALAGSARGHRVRSTSQLDELLAGTAGQILTTLPGVATVRAAAFRRAHAADRALRRHPSSSTPRPAWRPPATESATVTPTRRGSAAPGLPERRDALMSIAWGLSQHSPAFREPRGTASCASARDARPIEARVALARNACRLCHSTATLKRQEPFDESRYAQARLGSRAVTAFTTMPHDGAT